LDIIYIISHKTISIGGVDVWITDTVVNTWIVMGILIAFAIIVRIRIPKFKDVPTGFQNVVEGIVELFDWYLRTTAGEKLMFLGNWFFAVFLFILCSNIGGIILNFRPPTADWSMTGGLAIVTFVLIQVMGVWFRRGEYIVNFFKPFFLFAPLNIIGELARPISLSFRLFGNMLSGLVMMTLIYCVAPVFIRFVLPAALHAFFDLFYGILQTYIFCTLSLSFISASSQVTEKPNAKTI